MIDVLWQKKMHWDRFFPNMSMMACSLPDGYVENSGDCDDEDNDNHEGANEVCDGVDNDCDEGIDEDAIDQLVFYQDSDSDTFGVQIQQ